MNVEIKSKPSFAYLDIELAPGETIVAEASAMSSMSAELEMEAKLNGGIIQALLKKFLGSESFFINHFTNKSNKPLRLTLTQSTPGDIVAYPLNGNTLCLERGAYIASDPGVNIGIRFAGIASFIAREGLFKLVVSGHGNVYFGSYGGMVEKEINGEYIIDSGHLIAYGPDMKLKTQLSNGLIGSITSGEGFVTRISGKGKIYMQTRSLSGLVSWINRHLA
mgnify:CR=1 FL=1